MIYRSSRCGKISLHDFSEQFRDEAAAEFLPFLTSSKRGIVPERRMPPGATIRIHPVEEQEEESRRAKAG